MYDASTGSALWEFALGAYSRTGVSALCLELQDRYGANVMLMLHLCHAAAMGLERVDVVEAASAMAPLEQHLVSPLRRARRSLAAASLALGREELGLCAKRLLQSELKAERLQCLRVPDPQGRTPDVQHAQPVARASLESYFLLLPGEDWQRDAAASLAAAVFPR